MSYVRVSSYFFYVVLVVVDTFEWKFNENNIDL